MTKNILYIGRFQPFHLGHADAVRQIFQKFQGEKIKLFIGIGSAEDNFQPKNPITAGERFEIIESAMQELDISSEDYAIVPIRNINHYALWPQHVQQYLPEISVFASGSPLTQNLWENAFPASEILSLSKREDISGTEIRKAIAENDSQKIQKFLLPSVQKKIQKFLLADRLQKMKTSF